jgi:hypothetical protein
MNLARVIAAPLSIALALSVGCSDPPSPPAQGAVTIVVQPNTTGRCDASGPERSFPGDPAVGDRLQCSLANPDCGKPNDLVVVDGATNSHVACTVAASGDKFEVNVVLDVQPNVRFQATGLIGPSGGSLNISASGSVLNGNGLAGSCTLDIVPNFGLVKPGAIWAHYKCDAFGDPKSPSGAPCTAEGRFIFENCGS